MHYVRVTLATGQQLTITVDIPPGTPVDQLQIPGLPAPIASIVDLGSPESPPTPTPPPPAPPPPRGPDRRAAPVAEADRDVRAARALQARVDSEAGQAAR